MKQRIEEEEVEEEKIHAKKQENETRACRMTGCVGIGVEPYSQQPSRSKLRDAAVADRCDAATVTLMTTKKTSTSKRRGKIDEMLNFMARGDCKCSRLCAYVRACTSAKAVWQREVEKEIDKHERIGGLAVDRERTTARQRYKRRWDGTIVYKNQ